MPYKKRQYLPVLISSLKTYINEIETYEYEHRIPLLILIYFNLFSK